MLKLAAITVLLASLIHVNFAASSPAIDINTDPDLLKALDADIAVINALDDTRNLYSNFATQLSPRARILTASIGFTGELVVIAHYYITMPLRAGQDNQTYWQRDSR